MSAVASFVGPQDLVTYGTGLQTLVCGSDIQKVLNTRSYFVTRLAAKSDVNCLETLCSISRSHLAWLYKGLITGAAPGPRERERKEGEIDAS